MTQYWAISQPERLLEWLVAQGEAAPPPLFRIVAGRLQNPDLAASYADRIPPAARSEWIQTIADGFASRDPAGAAEWIERFRDEPAYAPSVAVIAWFMARYDGSGAADLLRLASLENDPTAVSRVATARVTRDPKAAVDWLQTLANEGVRRTALGELARVWMVSSPNEAERWVLSLPSGEERDATLYSMISAALITSTEPNDALFRAYSSGYARQVAAVNAARVIERHNEAAARRLLNRYVTDLELRQQFESDEALPPPN